MTDILDPFLPSPSQQRAVPDQPYTYLREILEEPDWTRFPGWSGVTEEEWRSAQWQRAHCIKSSRQLRDLMGDLLDERVYDDLDADLAQKATMSMLVPPQMINTMMRGLAPAGPRAMPEREPRTIRRS